MGKKWDYDVPSIEIWQEVLRVLKPGGYLLSFAGTRTQHRMAVRIEDAGFEIRDMIAWVYGSGFPKSLNIGKAVDKLQGNEREYIGANPDARPNSEHTNKILSGAVTHPDITKGTSEWEGWGTALKPALEPITVARKPLEGTVAENCLKWGVGGINIDASRVPSTSAYTDAYNSEDSSPLNEGVQQTNTPSICGQVVQTSESERCNDLLSSESEYAHDGQQLLGSQGDCHPSSHLDGEPAQTSLKNDQATARQQHGEHEPLSRCATELDNPSCHTTYKNSVNGSSHNNPTPNVKFSQGRFPSNLIHDGSDEVVSLFPNSKAGKNKEEKGTGGIWSKGTNLPIGPEYGDSGSAARFFYCAKASKSERNRGCEGLEEKETNRYGDFEGTPEHASKLNVKNTNFHPTVKPIALMEYLVKLVSKPNHIILDPFIGSGSTAIACKNLGRRFIGIEKDSEYHKIAETRLSAVQVALF